MQITGMTRLNVTPGTPVSLVFLQLFLEYGVPYNVFADTTILAPPSLILPTLANIARQSFTT
jgi:hypothetical protein